MECKVTKKGDVAVMLLEGSINTKESIIVFRESVDKVLELGVKRIVLDMEKLEYINSSGLGRLIMLEQELKKIEGALRAVKVSENILSVLKITRLNEIIGIYPDEETALKNF